jgi:hypothetical protein
MSKEFYNCNSDSSLIPQTSNQLEVFQQTTHIKFSKLHRLFKRKKLESPKRKRKKEFFTWVLEIQKLGSP